ncbi:IS3 family transposase [Intestinibaculum porci]|nr:IS3 family transposase [Intestinibaculum porci]
MKVIIVMSKGTVISDEAIKILSANKFVKLVRSNRISFTYEFRIMMWERWIKYKSISSIREVMKENGIDYSLFNAQIISRIQRNFKRDGKPTNGRMGNSAKRNKTDKNYDQFLVSTGKFIRARRGISFSKDYTEKLYSLYPDQAIEDVLKSDGFDPERIGYQRIHALKRVFDGDIEPHEKQTFDQNIIEEYTDHPMVERITAHRIKLTDVFYSEASIFSDMHINDILKIFDIDSAILTISTKQRIKKQITQSDHTCSIHLEAGSSDRLKAIALNLYEALYNKMACFLKSISQCIWDLSASLRREAFIMLDSLADSHIMPLSQIISEAGLSRSTFYSILRNDAYGRYEELRNQNEEEEVRAIIDTMNYKGYPKGKRTIHMMMPEITGKSFSIKKIARLMRKHGLNSGVRAPRQSLKAAREHLEKYKCPNLLKRKFRLAMPFTHILTDVSYLFFGANGRGYLSAVKDAVTGRILAAVVSENNDSAMTMETLKQLERYTFRDNAIFHSDQGALYLNEAFQKKVKELGFRESMSRRGICEDNSSQESFFGHFKDECDYTSCSSIEELREMVLSYVEYYNNERPQWTRNKMTPVKYESYLEAMPPEQFDLYMSKETDKYEKTKALATKRAKARANLILS